MRPQRLLLAALVLVGLSAPARAGDFALRSAVSAVTLYPQGATVTRTVPFAVPAGRHNLILTDLPKDTPLDSLRVAVEGATLGSISTRRDFVPPRDPETDAAIAAAQAEIARLEAALRQGVAGVEALRLRAKAAQARITFLEALSGAEGVAGREADALRALVAMIGEETLSALDAAHEASRKADDADRELNDLRAELKRARQALAALVPETKRRALLAVAVHADAAAEGRMTIVYNLPQAGWQPVYDLRLERATGRLAIERGALVEQASGENWRDVALRLSTGRPDLRSEPGEVWPWLRRIVDPEEEGPRPMVRFAPQALSSDKAMEAGALPAAPVIAEALPEGMTISYVYPDPVSVASGADSVRIALGRTELAAEILAQAAPLSDSTAYLMARITNTSAEPVLPAAEAAFYLDGRFVTRRPLPAIPAGGRAELAFGPVEGLRINRIVLARSEGDRGVISRSSQFEEQVRITAENLTAETWPLRLVDRVPHSEQQDLQISWSATPRPDEQDVDGRRGVLAWRFDIAPGQSRTITLSHRLSWPEGMELQ
ncbi:MAG: hypothetical protein Kow0058_17440 [Roseovarius sp.]